MQCLESAGIQDHRRKYCELVARTKTSSTDLDIEIENLEIWLREKYFSHL